MPHLIAGNWKMHATAAQARAIVEPLRAAAAGLGADLLVCPPATVLAEVARLLDGSAVGVGAQDCHAQPQGAHTGDLSAPMLRDAGAAWVILGHSERRTDHGESDAVVLAKVTAAIAAGLRPIVCVGETEAQRLAGEQDRVVATQLAGSLPEGFPASGGVIAYEPVWAIGTGRTPTEADVAAMHAGIRAELVKRFGEASKGLRILYGGSVKPSNAASLLAVPEVGGALVGGASLKAEDFLAIARGAPGALSKPAA
jgi:triosephosphate isomerase (TIM)